MNSSTRFDRLDALRGLAMAWMTLFHFCFDLNHFGWIKQNFYQDPVWTWQRTAIVSLFLLCAGAGQAVAVHQAQSWQRFWRRWAQVAACAVLVSLGSYLMYPGSFIYFGVLHGIAAMLIITRLIAPWGAWLWPLGAVAIATKFIAASAIPAWPALHFLNEKAFNWIGWVSQLPITEDYVPLFPWLGVMCWGMAAAQWLLQHRPALLSGPVPAPMKWLAFLGTWSLTYYMLHQPVMMGVMMVVKQI
jgi:uncharacterized membrane protein